MDGTSAASKGADMKKLIVAVGVYGEVAFLEKFPDDEEHGGLNELLDNDHSNIESNQPDRKSTRLNSSH